MRLHIVLGLPFPFLVHVAEPLLGRGIPLLRRTVVPLKRFSVIPWHAPTLRVHFAEMQLSFGITLLRQREPLAQRSGVISLIVRGLPFVKPCPDRRGCHT